jgi:hypothetical protein
MNLVGLLGDQTFKGTSRMRKFVITDPSGSPYLTRYVVEEFPDGSGIYLHFIHRSDSDREFHDHPWDFRSFIVRGGYIEHTPEGSREFYPGSWNVRQAEQLHRLELFCPEDTITILFRGPKRREWGFKAIGGEWTHNEAYLDAKFGKGNWNKEYE